MEKNGRVVLRDAEELSDVFPRALLEDAQRDDRTLNFTELGDAGPEPHVFYGARHELVRKYNIASQLVGVDLIVRARPEVPPPMVARRIADDRREDRRRVPPLLELTRADEIHQRAESLLDTVHGVFRRQSFLTRDGGEGAALGVKDLQQSVERVDVEFGWHGGAWSKVSTESKITRASS
jgi:hypothetical protein